MFSLKMKDLLYNSENIYFSTLFIFRCAQILENSNVLLLSNIDSRGPSQVEGIECSPDMIVSIKVDFIVSRNV